MSLLFLHASSDSHYEANSWRYGASKMGGDILDTLYVSLILFWELLIVIMGVYIIKSLDGNANV